VGTSHAFAQSGSQRWLQLAVNRNPQLILGALQRSGAIAPQATLMWSSPLETEDFREYRDRSALEKAGIANVDLKKQLGKSWPARGPGWDALGITSEGHPLFLEAKAHIPEAATPATRASATSLETVCQRQPATLLPSLQ
jgi:hypothetical protein